MRPYTNLLISAHQGATSVSAIHQGVPDSVTVDVGEGGSTGGLHNSSSHYPVQYVIYVGGCLPRRQTSYI